MDLDKISEIVLWHRPKNVHEVRQFLGLCGYYRGYVRNYAQVAAPLHEITKLGEQFLWTQDRIHWTSTLVTGRQEPFSNRRRMDCSE